MRVTGQPDTENDWKTVNEVKRLLHKNDIHSTTIQLEHDEASLNSCDGADCPRHGHSHTKCCEDYRDAPPFTPHASYLDINQQPEDRHAHPEKDADIALKEIETLIEKRS